MPAFTVIAWPTFASTSLTLADNDDTDYSGEDDDDDHGDDEDDDGNADDDFFFRKNAIPALVLKKMPTSPKLPCQSSGQI